ncbi:MAG: uroporphyrinogen decarboxylase family protein [bacterium]|nr:uroporphyrinogen decarboxylase family protein [bacterium]
MTKIERINRAIMGQELDRIPFSVWYHFGLQHLPGEAIAEAELGFYRKFDLDFIKVMNDYPYPLPEGIDEISNPEDWLNLKPLKPNEGGFSEQSRALNIIGKELNGEAYYIDTIFSPWSTARKLARDKIFDHQRTAPEQLKQGLEVITASFCAYIAEAVKNGLSGIFLSIGGASYELMTESEYQEFGRPYDLLVLDAANSAPFNVLHIHGQKIMFDLVNDYPVHALNWSHRHTAPSLIEARAGYPGCIIGGIDETDTDSVRPPEIKKQVRETIQAVGAKGVIIGPGCAIPTNTPAGNILAIKDSI